MSSTPFSSSSDNRSSTARFSSFSDSSFSDRGLHIEFPTIPSSDLHDFEKTLLHFLDKVGTADSISDLAKKLAKDSNENLDQDSFKSKVQYNINQLENEGFVKIKKEKNRHMPTLDTVGKLWVATHKDENPKKVTS